MRIGFNAFEVLEIAEQIERNGAKFYRLAAEGAITPQSRQLLLNLAAMEDEHERVFASMKADLSEREWESTVFDPDGQATLYLWAMADGQVFDVRADPVEGLTGKETMEEILQRAIGLEKESIVFYLGIKEATSESWGRERIDKIIKEEMGHIASLSGELASLRQRRS